MNEQIFINKLNVRFCLRTTKKRSVPVSVLAIVYYDKRQYKFGTGVKCIPSQWDKRRQRARVSLALKELDNQNNLICNKQLMRYVTTIKDLKQYVQCDPDQLRFMPQLIRDFMLRPRFGGYSHIPPLKWMQQHIKGLGETSRVYHSAFNVFCTWVKDHWMVPIRWDEVSLRMVSEYSKHCLANYSASRYNMLMMVVRMAINQAHYDLRIPFHDGDLLDYLRQCRVPTRIYDDGRVALTAEQVDTVYDFPLDKPREQQVRDMFVFQCLTSLRHSNVDGADFRAHRGKREFEVIQVKEKGSGNQHISLDFDPRIGEILERYGWHFPEISIGTYNVLLRKIIRKMPFANTTVYIKTRQADKSTRIVSKPLFEAVRSHNGRRTFITEVRSNPNVQDRDLVAFTGHKSIELLAIYDKTTKQRRAHNVLRAMGKIQMGDEGQPSSPSV